MTPTAPDPAEVAAAIGPPLGPRLDEGDATLRAYRVPGCPTGMIWRVYDPGPHHPMQVYVGRWPDGSLRVVSDDLSGFLELVEHTGVHLEDEETALGYVRALLEVTRAPSVLIREISNLDDIPWRPGTDAEEDRRRAFEDTAAVAPPSVVGTGDGFVVELSLVVDQRIQRNRFEVAPQGAVAASFEVLAEDLPLPIAR